MKKIKFILFLILILCQSSLISKSLLIENHSNLDDSTLVKYFYSNFDNHDLGYIYTYDTATILSSYNDQIEKEYEIYQTLTNSGLAHKTLSFIYPVKLGFNHDLTTYPSFLKLSDNVKYPIVQLPFAEIKYISGDKKEQHIEFLFTREFLPRFFISINCDVDFSPGIYKRSKMHNSFFNGNLRYVSQSGRYGIIGTYFHNKIDVQENGGIVYDSIFLNNIESDKSVIDVNLVSATNLIKVSGFAINQYFNILSEKNTNSFDTTENKRKIDVGRINYHLAYQRNSYVYEDNKPLASFYKNYDPVIDSLKTSDSVYFHTIKNVFYWNTLGYKKYNDDNPFYLTLGIEHNLTYHRGYWDYLIQERFYEQKLSNIRANAGIIINLFESTKITGNAQIITAGYHAGDYYIEGQWKQYLGNANKNLGVLKFDININRQSPDWFEEYYYSNNFRWNNTFVPTTSLLVNGAYELPFLTIGFKQAAIDNYIYFGTDAKPKQYLDMLSVSTLYSTFKFNLNNLEMIGFASLQSTNNDEVLHIPSFQAKLKVAYNITLVKNNSMMQPSIAVKYFTKYYADAYMPALRTFYLQNEVEVGNYPYIDLCVAFKIKRANIYVLYTNMYSLTKDNRYITTPHYPMRDSRLCLGINWRLYK